MITLFKFETEDEGTIIIPMEKIGVTIKDLQDAFKEAKEHAQDEYDVELTKDTIFTVEEVHGLKDFLERYTLIERPTARAGKPFSKAVFDPDLHTLPEVADQNQVWTWTECEDGGSYLIQGYHHANRLGYIFTENKDGEPAPIDGNSYFVD
jgi:hypothetical protein